MRVFLLLIVLSVPALAQPWNWAHQYKVGEVLKDPEPFLQRYVEGEARFFAMARHPKSALTYDGWNLDEQGKPIGPRDFSAPSKESLDVALLTKGIEGHPLAVRLISPDDPKRAPGLAAEILERKLDSYWAWYQKYPGYGGYFPWFKCGEAIEPTDNWVGAICGLDNGEWVWSMLVAEREARHRFPELADKLHRFNSLLKERATPIFYDPLAGLVRGDAKILDMKDPNTGYVTNTKGAKFLWGEHTVHEGVMLVMFVTLYGQQLPADASERIWAGTRMLRVDHPYGTSWQAWYGSAHEEWAYLFLPYRDLPEYRNLFRIRQAIRTQNANHRGYPGLHASALTPGQKGYWTGSGIEGLGTQKLVHQEMFALYGAYPVILEDRAVGAAWLLNMLQGPGQQTELGGGESGLMDGSAWCSSKTIDGTFTILLAVMGGMDQETTELLQEDGLYDQFREIMAREYREAFGTAALQEPAGLIGPPGPVPRATP